MYRGQEPSSFTLHSYSLMIVGNLHVKGMAVAPHKTNSPSVIDANRVLSLAVTSQSFQLVPWRRGEHAQLCGGVQLQQFPQCHPLEGAEASAVTILEKFLRLLRAKAPVSRL